MGKIRKTFTLLLAISFVISSLMLSSSTVETQSRTIIVPSDYVDIQTAINHANSGDTVLVKAGTYKYNEQNSILARPSSGIPDFGIIVNKSISLIGENRNTVISMDWYQGTARAVCIEADNVTFSGFTVISNSGQKPRLDLGSVAISASNCNITDSTFYGCLTAVGDNVRISNCTFEKSDFPGLVVTLSNSSITDNQIINNWFGGMDISDSSNVEVTGNNISSNGVASYGSAPLEYNGCGISLTTYNQNSNTNISIYRNNISGNSRFGIQFDDATSNSSVFGNNITNNGVGINLSNLGLRSYTPIGNGTVIFNNNLIGNSVNAFVETAYPYNLTADAQYNHVIDNRTIVVSWDNGVAGNYWSDRTGNGSYVIGENSIDHYPLTSPVDVYAQSVNPVQTATPFMPPRNPPHLDPTVYLIAASIIAAIAVLSFALYSKISRNRCVKKG